MLVVLLSDHDNMSPSCHMQYKSSKNLSSARPPTKQTTLIITEDGKVSTAKPTTTSVSKTKQATITGKHKKNFMAHFIK